MIQIFKAFNKILIAAALVLTVNLHADEPVEEIVVKGKVLYSDQVKALKTVLPKCDIRGEGLSEKESAKFIESAILEAAKKPSGELSKADLSKITKLEISPRPPGILSLNGLGKLTNLEELELGDTSARSLDELRNLTKLKKLAIYKIILELY